MIDFFRKQAYLIDFTLSSLLRRKGKNFGLLLVYTLIVFMLASVMLFTHSLRKEAGIILQQSPEIIVQRLVAGRHALIPSDYIEKMGRLRGVTSKKPRLWGYFYNPVVKANYTVMAPDHLELSTMEVIIGAGIARTIGLGIGDYFTLRAQNDTFSFEVKDILDKDSELVTTDLVLISQKAFRIITGIPEGQFTDIVLSVRNPREVRKVAEKLVQKLPDIRPVLREEILRTYDSIFSWRQGIVFVLLIGALLAFVIFAWDKASGLSAEEKREIGILKAVGWESGDILHMKFWEGVIISLSAFILGYLAAYLHVFYSSAVLFESVLKGWATLYPQFRLVPFIDGLQIATLFFFTIFPYVVATIIPIWKASVTDPDAIMR
ncbi:MAG: FtsX-like permease family protein [Gammaproteobacteria bacterium]|jgi:ABC-type lipoprotein release transport system permease subunit|nr:FtsX-like permease family protein [Gammaproteobacteria bacterium]MBT3725354.1 FtsX-like permease family protein [Gammaproteobacteria bacterium]MBT4078203.1 FtsX-like permease family protein [Gammaproteobacteria bacterium]MBT4194841.1 FtsX-like permease family protein [Gammaproteobacteria bacterium]MBT4450990.1 FtsX-like permease family protein [Gammaproteobacteria bacterium]